jgi:class 3 adenylate cyclase
MGDRLFDELLPSTILGVISACLGLVFLLIGIRTRSTVTLACTWMALGASATFNPLFVDRVGSDPTLLERMNPVFEAAVVLSATAYASALLATSKATPRARAVLTGLVRAGYAVGAGLFLIGAVFPQERANDYWFGLADAGSVDRQGYWLFAGAWAVVGVLFVTLWAALWRQQIDGAERVRAATLIAAVPLLTVSTTLPYHWAVWAIAAAVLIMLYGLFHYYAAAGERSAFLSRFLSPDVSALVDAHGLAEVMKPHEVELTVVCCDLRGFTAYAEAVPSQAVIDLLAEYYDAVGDAVAEHGGTIKDYAGDGVLVLVGAPLPRADHARTGLALANQLRDTLAEVTRHWSTGIHPLGLGIGVSSGRVTVGAIGSSGRMEYTAVGMAVNLASRLCSAAIDGQILLDHRTVELANAEGVTSRGSMQVKGMAAAQAVYAT